MDPRAGLRRFESRAMGSPLRLTLSVGTHDRAPAEGEGDRAWQAVVDEFEAAEEVLSRFRMTSELTGLNLMAGSGLAARPSPRLRRALAAADRAHRLTDGRFDPRVLADLDRLGYRGAPLDARGRATRALRPMARVAASSSVSAATRSPSIGRSISVASARA